MTRRVCDKLMCVLEGEGEGEGGERRRAKRRKKGPQRKTKKYLINFVVNQ